MTQGSGRVPEAILGNLLDGVVTVGRDGRIGTVNRAALRMFGLSREEAVGRSFGEAFIAVEGFDEFTDAVLEAVAGQSGATRRVIEVRIGEERRSLTVTISDLTAPGTGHRAGILAVLSDITEVRELRESELRMARELEERHEELQRSYRQIEERNTELASMGRKMQAARVGATVFVIGVFVALGLWSWGGVELGARSSVAEALAAPEPDGAGEVRTLVVQPRRVSSTISLSGPLAPWRRVNVTSPIDSNVKAIHFAYGRPVAEGEPLVELDTARIEREHRRARKEYVEARDKHAELVHWENSPEVADARRSLSRARMAMDAIEEQLGRTAFMLDQGLIAATRHEEAERQHRSRQLDQEAAEQALARVRAKGNAEALREAELELADAGKALRAAQARLGKDRVHSPIAGVVLAPGKGARRIEPGRSVSQGQLLVTIGDLSRLSVVAQVDEVDVTRIGVGQPVRVRGDAFPGLELAGAVSRVSSQANQGPRASSVPTFEVEVTLDEVEAGQRERLRVGMSSRLRIEVYRREDALLVPVDAVEVTGGGSWLTVVQRATGETQRRQVSTGVTTMRSVEVTQGLKAGERIVVR